MIEFLIGVGIVYVGLDFVTSIALGRCVMPGLKCPECR